MAWMAPAPCPRLTRARRMLTAGAESSGAAPVESTFLHQRPTTMPLSPIADIIEDFKAGRMAVLVDDEDCENEGDLIFATDFVSADKVNFLAKHGRGLICMPIT